MGIPLVNPLEILSATLLEILSQIPSAFFFSNCYRIYIFHFEYRVPKFLMKIEQLIATEMGCLPSAHSFDS